MNLEIAGIILEDVIIEDNILKFRNKKKRDHISNLVWYDMLPSTSSLFKLLNLAKGLRKSGYRARSMERVVLIQWIKDFLEVTETVARRYQVILWELNV